MGSPIPPADSPADPIAAPLSAFAELDPVHPTPPLEPALAPAPPGTASTVGPAGMVPVATPSAPISSAPTPRGGASLSRVGPVSGVVFVASFLLSFMTMSTPNGDASDREWTSHWEDSGNRTQGIIAAFAMLLAAVMFLWLVAALRRRLAGAVGTDAFYAAGIAAGTLMFVSSLGAGLVPLGYELADTPIPEDADLLRLVDGLYFATVFLPLPYAFAGFLIPLFFALRGSLLVPRWLEWTTLVVGVVALGGPLLFFVPHLLVLLWTLAISVTLLVRERPA
jgi:hypothetical protein